MTYDELFNDVMNAYNKNQYIQYRSIDGVDHPGGPFSIQEVDRDGIFLKTGKDELPFEVFFCDLAEVTVVPQI